MLRTFQDHNERLLSLEFYYNTVKNFIMNESKKGKNKYRFSLILHQYFHGILSDDKELQKQHEKEALKYVNILEIDKEKKTVIYAYKNQKQKLIDDTQQNGLDSIDMYGQYWEMPRIFYTNILIMLLTRFEEFISSMLVKLFSMFPQKYLDSQQISFSDISECGVEEIKRKIIYREVECAMRDSYTKWFEIFKSHGATFSSCNDLFSELAEIYARRNIFVHNSGTVNAIYLKNVPSSNAKIGDRLELSSQYIEKAFNTVKTVMYKIAIEFVRIIDSERASYLYCIFEEAFSELRRENYVVTSKVFQELADNKYSDSRTKTMAKVNTWISQIEISGLDAVKKDIEQFDVSILDTPFVLAKDLLLQDYESAIYSLEACIKADQISAKEIKEWPLFKRFRESKEYKDFIDNHKSLFEVAKYIPADEKEDDESIGALSEICG